MANLEKFFCVFALLIASLMSLLLCVVMSAVPVCNVGPNGARQATAQAEQPGVSLQQREPNLDPRAPSDSFMSPTPDE